MRPAHPREREVGMAYYVSDADGTGGRLREADGDFRVRELERFDAEPVDADPGSYNHLVLRVTLSGWDTNDFAKRLSDALGISRERVAWAGTKDKYAVTTQLFSVAGVDPDDLPDVRDADVEVVGRAGRSIEFGDLAGNEFEIAVTDPAAPDNAEAVADDLRAFGGGTAAAPNFFGQQRFGSKRPVTHEVGLRVVREDWAGAVMAYLGNPRESEPEGTREAREFVEETRDWAAALERFPRRLGYERSMLHALVETGGTEPADFRAALEEVPSNLQRLFVHAAQSYAFNRILSERLDRGLPFDRPVEGDVVCFADTDAPDGLALPDTDRLQRVTADRVDTVARHCERGRAFVTAPLVGTETDLGDGEPGDIERAVLDDLNLSPGDFDLPGEFGSTGTRRAVLVRTDLSVERDPLRFSFTLPKGSYATVILREFLKCDPLDLG
ncbi:tRNA pseudouridine(13) synthase TruD [Halostella litorea]|uniref:tRNA pseudouridine(13) synthase TruD n=1 Tax=Halostella litorea TaxID=2528831 RepID=UPI0010920705|nr:tRNA pseudouridine(13) synthase TruD [Halostella litorea]